MFTISTVYKLKILLGRLRCGSITLMIRSVLGIGQAAHKSLGVNVAIGLSFTGLVIRCILKKCSRALKKDKLEFRLLRSAMYLLEVYNITYSNYLSRI